MPRTFKDSIATDCEDVFFNVNEFAQSVTYHRPTADDATITAVVGDEKTIYSRRKRGNVRIRRRDVLVKDSDISTPAAMVDSITINGRRYVVANVTITEYSHSRLECEHESVEDSDQDDFDNF